jgi:hypothetical protein
MQWRAAVPANLLEHKPGFTEKTTNITFDDTGTRRMNMI